MGIAEKRFDYKMASSSVSALNNRIQYSVEQAIPTSINSISDTSVNKYQVKSQFLLNNMKSTTNDSSTSDGGAVNDLSSKPSLTALANSETTVKEEYGHIRLDISNSVLPREKLASSPSANDGLAEDTELQIRSLGCELIQLAGKLLKLPQVAMATGCVLFQRFFYAKSLIRYPFDHVAMACIGLASKIEESPRRVRDIINVFHHIKQVRNGRTIQPMILDQHYISLKNQVIKAERRVLKELGFCVHVKHPHKIIVMYLKWLEAGQNMELQQMSWNFMNDSLRTDVFVRYAPETIATACIYLSARKLKVPLPKNPSWFDVLSVEEDDIKDCCYRIMCLYDRKKPNHEDLERKVEELRRKIEENKKLRSAAASAVHTPSNSSPASRTGSPANNNLTANHERDKDHRDKDIRDIKLAKRETREGYQMNANSFGGERRSSSVSSRHSRSRRWSEPPSEHCLEKKKKKKKKKEKKKTRKYRTYCSDLDSSSSHTEIPAISSKIVIPRSHSGGDDHNRRDRKKGKQKRRGAESPDDVSPSKKNKRHVSKRCPKPKKHIKKSKKRDKSRYDDRGHHPDYYDRRLGRDQIERTINSSINDSRSDEYRSYGGSDKLYYGEDRRDRGSGGYNTSSDQRNNGSFKERDRDYYKK